MKRAPEECLMMLLHGQADLLFCQRLPPMQLARLGLLNGAVAGRAPGTPSQSWGRHNVRNMAWLSVAASRLVMRVPSALGLQVYLAIVCIAFRLPRPPPAVPGIVPRPPMGIPSTPPLWAPEAYEPCSWPIPSTLANGHGAILSQPSALQRRRLGPGWI